ncbi:MAG: DNA-binding protein, partial [Myxococcales bacterium]|nr:DNA-binding protein [Myxococcales bacterium]
MSENAAIRLLEENVVELGENLSDAAVRPERKRGRRKRRSRARARTISIRRLSKSELNRGRLLYPETDYWKPVSRSACADMVRPCPFVSCKYHLYVDVHPVRGSIKLNFPDVEVWEMTETCALDVADR